jgi:feruloyl esterase
MSNFLGISVALLALYVAPARAQVNPAPADSSELRCAALAGGRFIDLPGAPTWVIRTTHSPATNGKRAHCDVAGYVNPTVNFGMVLPSEGWNGKFVVRGCGGSCGVVATDYACSRHLRDGYACLHTDMGHRSDQIDNNWVANNLQGLIDFGYRATHVATVAGKAIAASYYDRAPRRSYFYGCSTGGRQAMIEAQRFPGDFDGIVAVAPVDMAGFGKGPVQTPAQINRDSRGDAILTDLQVPLLYKAVMAKCDLNDGLRDNLIDRRDCRFDPTELQCKAGATVNPQQCLTPEQVEVARHFYARGAAPGSELNWINNWTAKPGPPAEFVQSRGDPVVINTLNNAGNPDLRGFRDRGGKLILVHGYTDLIIPPGPTIDYYELATRTMGGLTATQQFARLFLIPGMDHCSGGDGAWGVSYLPVLDDWVERGKAPDSLLGVHPKLGAPLDYFGIDVPLLKPEEIEFTRRHFAYPLKSYYAGHGDPQRAESFVAALTAPRRTASATAATVAPDAQSLVDELQAIITATERSYTASGLPAKNVTDRIGKAVRLRLYNSGASDSTIAAALTQLRRDGLTVTAANALTLIDREYGLDE